MDNPNPPFSVLWRGHDIGTFTVTGTDHQYWDGTFLSNGSQAAQDFTKLAQALDLKAVYQHWEKGTRVELHSSEPQPTHAVVMAMDGPLLNVRFAYNPEVIAWMQKNVL